MSKKSFCVFGAENYIQKEIVEHLQNTLEDGEAFLRIVCSEQNHNFKKEGKITKIINKEKPKLFKKYVQKSNHIFIDLILNEQREQDVDMICKAIQSKREFEDNISIVVISNFGTWNQTDPYLYYKQFHPHAYYRYIQYHNMPNLYEEEIANNESEYDKQKSQENIEGNNQESQEENNQENLEENQPEIQQTTEQEIQQETEDKNLDSKLDSSQMIQQTHTQQDIYDDQDMRDDESITEEKKFIKVDKLYKKFFNTRNCKDENLQIKILEDKLANLHKVNEKVNVYILYTSLLYGRSQMFLKPYFNKAYMQKTLSIHYDDIKQNYSIPIFSVLNIPKVVMKLIETEQESEQQEEEIKSLYYGEEEQSSQDNQKNQEKNQEIQNADNPNEEDKNSENETKLPGKLVIKFLNEKQLMTHKSIIETISNNLGNGKLMQNIKFKHEQSLLNNYNIEEDLKFQSIIQDLKCFQETIEDQIVDYMIEESLNPIKIFFYCTCKYQKYFIQELSQLYNIRLIDCENFLEKLYKLEGFKLYQDQFTKNDQENFDKLMKTNVAQLFNNPIKNKQLIIFYIRLLKIRLSLNDCKYKGFVLIYRDYFVQYIQFQQLFYKNILSSQYYLKCLIKAKKQEQKILRKKEKLKLKKINQAKKNYELLLEKQQEESAEQIMANQESLKNENENQSQESDEEKSQQNDDDNDEENEEQNDQSQIENKQEEQQQQLEEQQEENQQEEIVDQQEEDEELSQEENEQEEEGEPEEETNNRIREEFFPQHFVLMFMQSEKYSYIEKVQQFCIEKQMKFFVKKLNENDCQNQERLEQILHLVRVYLNREKKDKPKAINETDFEKTSEKKLEKYMQKISASQQILKITNKYNRNSIAQQHDQQFQNAIKYFHEFRTREGEREIEESKKYKNNREILTKIFYDVLYEGLLNIKKLNPSDPFEYLSNFIYEKSFEENQFNQN